MFKPSPSWQGVLSCQDSANKATWYLAYKALRVAWIHWFRWCYIYVKTMLFNVKAAFILNPGMCHRFTWIAKLSLILGSRSKKVIPVLKESCQLPSILRHITICDFTKGDLKEWFWDRLARAIQMPVDISPDTDALDRQRLSQVHFKIESSPSSSNIWLESESKTGNSSNNSHSSTRSSNNSTSLSPAQSAIHSSRC